MSRHCSANLLGSGVTDNIAASVAPDPNGSYYTSAGNRREALIFCHASLVAFGNELYGRTNSDITTVF